MADNTEPQMIVMPGTDRSVATRIQAIDRSISRDPEAFITAFQELGATATDGVIEFSDRDTRIPTATRAPAKLIKEFLTNRYDLDSEFDVATETALKDDETYTELVDAVRSKKAITVKKGQMSSEARPHPEAEDARDALRRYRFGVYLGRKAAYKATETDLQSAV